MMMMMMMMMMIIIIIIIVVRILIRLFDPENINPATLNQPETGLLLRNLN